MTLCAHCVNERDDCIPVDYDGKTVQMCGLCREGPVSAFSFVEPDRGTIWQRKRSEAGGVGPGKRYSLGNGNYRVVGGELSIGARKK